MANRRRHSRAGRFFPLRAIDASGCRDQSAPSQDILRTEVRPARYSTDMLTRTDRMLRPLAFVAPLVLAALPVIAQVATADAEKPRPPVPTKPEDLGGGHMVMMIIFGLGLLALVIGACLIPAKRGHMD